MEVILKSNSVSKLNLIIKLAKKLGIVVEERNPEKIEHIPNRKTRKAIEDIKKGKTNKYKNSQELFNKLGI